MRHARRSRHLLGAAIAVALALIAMSGPGGSSPLVRMLREAAGSVAGGAERLAATVTGPIGRFFGPGLPGAAGHGAAAALERQVIRLRAQLSAAELTRAEYLGLRRVLGLAGAGGYRVVVASVIAFGQGGQQTVTIDAGTADGVRAQQTVIDGNGLVGQVIAASPGTSTVLLVSAPGSVAGVRLAPGGQLGWVTGQGGAAGGGLLSLQVLDPSAALAPGEQLVTAASLRDRPFVPGIPVGVIAAVRGRAGALTARALVRPYADLGALDIVGVVTGPPPRDPRFAMLPGRGRRG